MALPPGSPRRAIRVDPEESERSLISTVSPAAIELWTNRQAGLRAHEWRRNALDDRLPTQFRAVASVID